MISQSKSIRITHNTCWQGKGEYGCWCQLTWQLRPGLEIHVPHIGGICRLGAKGLQVTCDGQRAIQLDPTAHGVCLTSLVLLGGAYGVRILLTQLGHRIGGDKVALVELCGKAHDLILTLAALLLAQHKGLQYLYLLQSECETNEDFYYNAGEGLLLPHLLLYVVTYIAEVDELRDEGAVGLLELQGNQILANIGRNALLYHLAAL